MKPILTSILNYISVVIQEEVKTIPAINMMKTDKMLLATLMTKTILAPRLRIDKRWLMTMAVNKTWVAESLTEIDLQDLLESTVFENPYNND